VRAGKWKLHFPHDYRAQTESTRTARGGKPGQYRQETIAATSLFDLEADPGETKDVAGQNPDVVKRLSGLGDRARSDLGDSLRPPENKPSASPVKS
jgi:hypothetical protein